MNAPNHKPRLEDHFLTRRDFLGRCGVGFGMVSLATLLAPEVARAVGGKLQHAGETPALPGPLTPKAPHFPAKAKRVIHIFANCGASHLDTLDPQPSTPRLQRQPTA